ncbi:MAG TPA: helix-turn-helix domain-containing protein [Thermoleophilaceae bacterium]|nr:helix-turn-helix domain-containing protein [Thermoleophilaceae bacterium]
MSVETPSPPAVDPELLDAAHRAIERHGWQAATLERIAEEAGVSRMTLHRRKVSRDAVLRALGARLEAQHREAMLTALAAPGDARQRLAAALEAECRLAERNLALGGALDAAGRDAIYHEQGRPALTRDAFVAPYRRLLTDGAADGTLAATDAEETATVLINLVTHTYRHLRQEHGWDADRARRAVCAIALDGVTA